MIREVADDDREPINAVLRRNGLDAAELSAAAWSALWHESPFDETRAIPTGWVLEAAGVVVGYLGNIALRYHFAGRRLVGVAAHAFAVDAEHRNQSIRLAAAFFAQTGVDLLLNTSANAATASVFQLCKAERIPQADCDTALFWITDQDGFSRAGLRRHGIGSAVATLGAAAIAPMLKMEGQLRHRGPLGVSADYELAVIGPEVIGSEFDELWSRWLAGRKETIVADRSAVALRWHYADRDTSYRQPRFIVARRSGIAEGYASLIRDDHSELGLSRLRVVDLVAVNDEPGLVDELLRHCYQFAQSAGVHVIEMTGFPKQVRSRFAAGNAYSRQLPSSPYWFKATPDLAPAVRHERAWYATPFDGDATI